MDRCPVHPAFFKTVNTPCPGCRADFDDDIPAASMAPGVSPAKHNSWTAAQAQEASGKLCAMRHRLRQVETHLKMCGALALIGWSIVVVICSMQTMSDMVPK